MTETGANPWLLAGVLGAIIAFTAVKLFWGVSQWAKKPQHRVGDRWGEETVEVTEWAQGGKGYVLAGGELWRAISKDALAPGDRVYVQKVKGLTLEVRKG